MCNFYVYVCVYIYIYIYIHTQTYIYIYILYICIYESWICNDDLQQSITGFREPAKAASPASPRADKKYIYIYI